MRETCPLGNEQVWGSDIPDKCRGCIEEIADYLPVTNEDMFEPACGHFLVTDNESLQRLPGRGEVNRLRGVLLVCMSQTVNHGEVSAEETEFTCPNDQ